MPRSLHLRIPPVGFRYLNRILALIIIIFLLRSSGASAQSSATRVFIAMGSADANTIAGFIDVVKKQVENIGIQKPHILVLPVAYSSNPLEINEKERSNDLADAEEKRLLIQEACQQVLSPEISCVVDLAPVLVRAEALDFDVLKYFDQSLIAVIILGSNQTIAMQVLENTALEKALDSAYHDGVLIAGADGGSTLQSVAMIGGFNANYSDSHSLEFGTVGVWNSADQRGLTFGLPNAILETQFYQDNRLGRLLNAISLPGVPHVGIGIDANTAVEIKNEETIEGVFGNFTVTILDATTYNSAHSANYRPCFAADQCNNLLSLRNVLVHMIAPGSSSYDLKNLAHSMGPPLPQVRRNFEALSLSSTAAPLILAGRLNNPTVSENILFRFTNLSGGLKANLLIVTVGYADKTIAREDAQGIAGKLKPATKTTNIPANVDQPIKIPTGITGIILIGDDPSLIKIDTLTSIRSAWMNGTPLLAVDSAAAVSGTFFVADSPTLNETTPSGANAQKAFLNGHIKTVPGLDLIHLNIEPRILTENRWGRLFTLAHNHLTTVAWGLNDDMAIEITTDGVTVIGNNDLLSLDLRTASVSLGQNQGFIIANGLLDVFAPGDTVKPIIADIEQSPLQGPTPVQPTNTPTSSPTATATQIPSTVTPTSTSTHTATLTSTPTEQSALSFFQKKPTRTPRPTSTPVPIPPPSDPKDAQRMILLSVIMVGIILTAVWLNRKRI